MYAGKYMILGERGQRSPGFPCVHLLYFHQEVPTRIYLVHCVQPSPTTVWKQQQKVKRPAQN